MKHLLTISLLACLSAVSLNAGTVSIIPQPAEIVLSEGRFRVKGAGLLVDDRIDAASERAIGRFVSALETAAGRKLKHGREGGFSFVLDESLAPEQYSIRVDKNGVLVEASALNGFVYACETLKQMLPPAVYGAKKAKADWSLPYVTVLDQPRFAYRGMHMDSARHFWSVDEVKRYLDVMTAYKMNRFHWHLTDDQGWRAEIKAYPLLTEIGAWRNGTQIGKDRNSFDNVRYGGFYTQEQMREVVAYAAARGITVIPEIDLPGHMVAALASYPELGCTGGPYEVWKQWSITVDILCAGNEAVFTFLNKVFDELLDIFPSEYIHIGGDECFGGRRYKGEIPWDHCPKCLARMKELGIVEGPEARHYLQNYVTARIQGMLAGKGRRIIGWDEILQGELSPGATVMSWRGVSGGIKAAQKGFDVIMAPNTFMYLDYCQSEDQDKEPISIGHYLPVETVYGYEPYDGLEPEAQGCIIGVQGCLWTEYISEPWHLEYMLLPRLCALSEVQWCAEKDYERFTASLRHSLKILDAMGVNYRKN